MTLVTQQHYLLWAREFVLQSGLIITRLLFFHNSHNSNPIACPWRRVMGRLLRLQDLIYVLHLQVEHYIQRLFITERAMAGPHYGDVIMSAMASQFTILTIVYSTALQVQIKENIKAPRHWLCEGNSPVTGEFPHKRPVARKMFPFDDVIMGLHYVISTPNDFVHSNYMNVHGNTTPKVT